MQYRILGRTALRVSVIGFGGIPIWGDTSVFQYGCVDEETAAKVINRALDLGVNFIDTARIYGQSEVRIGKVMRRRRKECYLATKVMRRGYREGLEDVEKSLTNLQTDYIDLYQIHYVNDTDTLRRIMARDGALRALKEKRKEGKIGFIGITGHEPKLLMKAIKTGEFDTIQAVYNLNNLEAARELFPLARRENIGVIVMKPLAGAILVPPLEMMTELKEEDRTLIGELKESAFPTTAMAAIKFAMDNEAVSTVIPGMGSITNVEEDVAVGRTTAPLPKPLKEKLIRGAKKLGTGYCRSCGYCLPCSQGINIPDIFRFEGYYSRYGLKEWARQQYAELPVKAESCVQCEDCLPRCPYNIPIMEKMKKAAKILSP
ncbi:aldo/keto reductase [candidate division NPL-UPA2 bacterium]|nr:aldo/keto reductase [candidate division NPL-UPA2 bacterium]